MLAKPFCDGPDADVRKAVPAESKIEALTQTLREKEERYKLMFETAPVGYQSLDKNDCILDVNRFWLDTLGYQRDEVTGAWFGKFIHHDQKEIFRKLFPVNLESRTPADGVELNLKRKDGNYIITEYNCRIERDPEGRFVRTHCVFQDITRHRQSENALKEREAQLHAILDASIDSIRLVDRDMRIIWTNKIIETQLRKERHHVIGDYCYHAYTGRSEPCPNCPTIKALNSGKTEHSIITEQNVKGKKGISYWADYTVPIKNDIGEIVNFIQVSRDITDLKNVETALTEEKNKLEIALAKVKKLKGLLPICAQCKKIRDDKGYWNQIEAYIQEHSEALFSHGICPDCARMLYPDMYPDAD